MKPKDWGKLIVALLLPQLAGAAGSFFTAAAIPSWYATLVRPELAPPNWVFAPVWTTLYFLMGIALFLVWRKGLPTQGVRLGLYLFGLQLIFNVLWSVLFFGFHSPALALLGIGILWLTIFATLGAFWRVSRGAALLLIPYFLWVSFAALLNYQFFVLNS